jgi:hypothetical protein
VVLEVIDTRIGEAAEGEGIVGEEGLVVVEISIEGRETKVLVEVTSIGRPHLLKAPLHKVCSGKPHLRRICNGRHLLVRIFSGKPHRVQNLARAILTRPILLVVTICNWK